MFEKLIAALEAIGVGLRDLNVNLAAAANGKAATTPAVPAKAPPPKSAPAATGAAPATPAAAPAPAATASISYQDLATKFTDLVSVNKEKALAIFAEFGCKKKLTELKVEQYDAFAAAIDAASAPAEEEGGLV